MEEPAQATDQIYEESRRKAEQSFYSGFNDWVKRLDKAAAEMAERSNKFDRKEETEQLDIPARWELKRKRGQVMLAIRDPIRDELITLCSEYAQARVRAFAELLFRKGAPREVPACSCRSGQNRKDRLAHSAALVCHSPGCCWCTDEGGPGAHASCQHRNNDGCLHRGDGEGQKRNR